MIMPDHHQNILMKYEVRTCELRSLSGAALTAFGPEAELASARP